MAKLPRTRFRQGPVTKNECQNQFEPLFAKDLGLKFNGQTASNPFSPRSGNKNEYPNCLETIFAKDLLQKQWAALAGSNGLEFPTPSSRQIRSKCVPFRLCKRQLLRPPRISHFVEGGAEEILMVFERLPVGGAAFPSIFYMRSLRAGHGSSGHGSAVAEIKIFNLARE